VKKPVLWIVIIWQTIVNYLRSAEVNIEAEYTPIRFKITGSACCINCGHKGSIRTPVGEPEPQVENRILDMLKCPMCGLYTMCTR
jgi:hypothetical protein